ncbi:cache domain-containing protein, partial [Clostridioides difficile]|uniref:cache domain-containing protein n=1 Tax=Clostridioides difficile TaxID=1496 RepID=UPI0018DB8AEB
FSSAFQAGDGLRVWIAGRDGTVIFHPLQRFVGSNVANLRPVAAGLQKLASGKSEEYTQRYLGLEGREALGAWTTLPAQGL